VSKFVCVYIYVLEYVAIGIIKCMGCMGCMYVCMYVCM